MRKLKLTGIHHTFPSKKGRVSVLADISFACRARGVRFHYRTIWQWEEHAYSISLADSFNLLLEKFGWMVRR